MVELSEVDDILFDCSVLSNKQSPIWMKFRCYYKSSSSSQEIVTSLVQTPACIVQSKFLVKYLKSSFNAWFLSSPYSYKLLFLNPVMIFSGCSNDVLNLCMQPVMTT